MVMMARRWPALLLAPAVLLPAVLLPAPSGHGAPAGFTPGAAGAGDPYFPKAGNGGYDAVHYDIAFDYRPSSDRLTATTTITATATQPLSRFNLDFVGNTITALTVDGVPARYRRDGQELVVTPRSGIHRSARFTVKVAYRGKPGTRRDPGLGKTGWLRTPDGATTLSQPQGSATWFPLNGHPSDKATHTFHATVPRGLKVLANGEPAGTWHGNGMSTFRWRSTHPMAGYLTMVAIGVFDSRSGRTPDGLRSITAVDPSTGQSLAKFHRTTGKVTDWGVRNFGPYPFGSTGGLIDDVPVGYALETQTRPVYPGAADTGLIVHELAHQWFGDSVTPRTWKDIWLNEGFATYAEWMWSEQHGGPSAKRLFARAYDRPAKSKAWKRPTGDPGRDGMFDFFPVYTRGAMTLHALRTTVGDRAFARILRTWTAEHARANATTAQFVELAERISGRSLDGLFTEWLYSPDKPPKP